MPSLAKSAKILCISCVLAARAGAEEAPAVDVAKGSGAETCPDAPELLSRVEAIRGETRGNARGRYEVVFERDARGLVAAIRAPSSTSSRVLRDAGPSCAALAQATAVTLALLFDANGGEPREPAPDPRPASPVDRAPEAARAPKPSNVSATLSLGGGPLAGVMAPVVPAFFGDAGLELTRFRTSVGALAVFTRTMELDPGSVRQSLATGFARSCLAPWRGSRLRFDVCSGVYAGVLRGEGGGFTTNESVSTPWLALPLELAVKSTAPGFGWELGVAALFPLRRHDFTVDGVGVAYDSPPVAGLLSLRAVGLWAL